MPAEHGAGSEPSLLDPASNESVATGMTTALGGAVPRCSVVAGRAAWRRGAAPRLGPFLRRVPVAVRASRHSSGDYSIPD
jgi:hypothetical protein